MRQYDLVFPLSFRFASGVGQFKDLVRCSDVTGQSNHSKRDGTQAYRSTGNVFLAFVTRIPTRWNDCLVDQTGHLLPFFIASQESWAGRGVYDIFAGWTIVLSLL